VDSRNGSGELLRRGRLERLSSAVKLFALTVVGLRARGSDERVKGPGGKLGPWGPKSLGDRPGPGRRARTGTPGLGRASDDLLHVSSGPDPGSLDPLLAARSLV